ncbi:MAG: hypothetical protein ACK4RM_00820 [Flavobacterium sp.]
MEKDQPVVFNKYLVSLTKIIAFYSFFIILIKSYTIFRGAWLLPNLVLLLPFIVFGVLAAYTSFFQKYNWWVAGFGALMIILVRIFEQEWIVALHHYFEN